MSNDAQHAEQRGDLSVTDGALPCRREASVADISLLAKADEFSNE